MPGPADLLLVGARVFTLDPAQPRGEAVAIRGGRILAVGAWADLRGLAGPTTEVVDAAGGVAIPAFHDAHLHLLSYARTRARVDCRGARSIGEIGAALAARARTMPPGAWVRAWGYDEARLRDDRHPDRHDLDGAVPRHPVRLQHRSLHLDVLNTAALRLLGLLDGPSALVEREPGSGEVTGRLYHAAELLRDRLAHPSENELAGDVREASDRLLAWGVTTVQDASATNGPAEWALFQRLAASGALGVRVFMMPGARPPPRRSQYPAPRPQFWGELGPPDAGGYRVPASETTGGLTLMRSQGEMEDALTPQGGILRALRLSHGERELRAARLSEGERELLSDGERKPLSQGEGGLGVSRLPPRLMLGPVKVMLEEGTSDPAEVRAVVSAARAAGRAVALHAVSEAEVAIALDALRGARARRSQQNAAERSQYSAFRGERSAGSWGAGASDALTSVGYRPRRGVSPAAGVRAGRGPDRIEHGAVIADGWLPELRALGVMVVGQPGLVYERGSVYRAAYPPELHGWLHRAGSLVRAGVGYAAGSDAPVTEPAPGLGLFAARRRLTWDGAVLGAAEALGDEEALAAFTLGPARAVGAEGWLGRLRPGMVADIAVLDEDVLEAASAEAALRPARLTIMEGRVVWRATDR